MAETVATCPETSQAMQRYDEDPRLHHPNGGTPPNLLESVELKDQDTIKMDGPDNERISGSEHPLMKSK